MYGGDHLVPGVVVPAVMEDDVCVTDRITHQIFPTELRGHCVLFPHCEVFVLNVHGEHGRVMRDLGESREGVGRVVELGSTFPSSLLGWMELGSTFPNTLPGQDGTGLHFSQYIAGVDGTGFNFSQCIAGVDGTGFHFSQHVAGVDGTGFHFSQHIAGVSWNWVPLSQHIAGVDGIATKDTCFVYIHVDLECHGFESCMRYIAHFLQHHTECTICAF